MFNITCTNAYLLENTYKVQISFTDPFYNQMMFLKIQTFPLYPEYDLGVSYNIITSSFCKVPPNKNNLFINVNQKRQSLKIQKYLKMYFKNRTFLENSF